MKSFIGFFLVLSIFSSMTHAGQYEYQCKVLDAVDVDNSGKARNRKDLLNRDFTFMVDRTSGTIVGTPFGNTNSTKVNTTVLDAGSKKQAYKVLSIYKPFVAVDYLSINEFEDGESKPFIGLSLGTLFTGICR